MKHMLLAAVLSGVALSAHGQPNAGTRGTQRCQLEGVSAMRIERDAAVTRLRGSVQIRVGTAVISADEADVLTDASGSKEFAVRGNVRVTIAATSVNP